MFFSGGKTHDFCFGVNAVIARWSHSGGTLENTAGMRSQQAIFHQRFFGERKAEWLKLFLFHLKLPGCITEIEKSQQRFSIPPGYRPPDGRYRRSKTVQRADRIFITFFQQPAAEGRPPESTFQSGRSEAAFRQVISRHNSKVLLRFPSSDCCRSGRYGYPDR